jgi:putative transposase
VRNGTRSKIVVSDAAGEVEINFLRGCESTFEPQIVKKRRQARELLGDGVTR